MTIQFNIGLLRQIVFNLDGFLKLTSKISLEFLEQVKHNRKLDGKKKTRKTTMDKQTKRNKKTQTTKTMTKQTQRNKKLKEKEKYLKLRKERDRRNNHVTHMFSEAADEAKLANTDTENDTENNTEEVSTNN